jgi:hypothetical protein
MHSIPLSVAFVKKLLLLGLTVSLSIPVLPIDTTAFSAGLQPAGPDHQAWNALLQRYVNQQGRVNYADWRNNMQPLNTYLQSLTNTPPTPNWSRESSMAYWINAYNAFTIKIILDNPGKNIRELHNGNPWDVKWIRLGNKMYSLNQIEHDILRAQYADARIHFALNCAAVSCPPLCREAFTAANLDSLLEQQTRLFVRSSTLIHHNSRKISVSTIFDWYAADFGKLTDFLNRYLEKPVDEQYSIVYDNYNWALNSQ